MAPPSLKASARPVAAAAPSDPRERRRLAAWLGLREDDLDRAFAAAAGPLPLGEPAIPAAAEARASELVAAGLSATVADGARPFQKASDLLLKVGLLAALLWGVGYAVASGVEPTIGHGPVPGWMVFGVILPTFFSSVVAGLSLPAWLVLRIIGTKRQVAAGKQLSAAGALVEGLATRDLTQAAAAVDARARSLGRIVVEADLAEAVEQDLLAAIADCRAALRGDPPAEALAVAEDELSALEGAIRGRRAARFSEEDASAPLARLRAANRALQAFPQG